MIFLKIVQFLAFFLFLSFVFTQMVIPMLTRTKMFPMFSKRRKKIEAEIIAANEELKIRELEKAVPKIKQNTIK